MTIQQQAYGLIDELTDESVQVVIQVMRKMLPQERRTKVVNEEHADLDTPKMLAYKRMQELRRETAQYDISETQRDLAMKEKYGNLG